MLTALLWAGAAILAAEPSAALKRDLWDGDVNLGKVSSELLRARRLAREGTSAQRMRDVLPGLPVRNDLPDIEIRLSALTPEIVTQVQAIGVHVTGIYYRYALLYGQCDPALLDQIAAIPEVTSIFPNYPPVLNVGAVTSQADASIRAAQARAAFGVDGSGIKVGVLSDSFNSVIGGTVSGTGCSRALSGSTPQQSGDLPGTVTLLDNGPGGMDEGAALAELIHDLAPGAAIMFDSGANGEATLAQGIEELRHCGADVIVDDLGYHFAPMFQDGLAAQAAQQAVDGGIPYFSAAGNLGRLGVDEVYQDADPSVDDQSEPPSGSDLHRFGSGSPFAAITLPPNCLVRLVLQWNEPFSGMLGPGAASDLDLYTYASPSVSADFAASTTTQGCGFPDGGRHGDPVETLLLNSSVAATLYVAVEHFCGNEDVRFRIAVLPIDCPPFDIIADPAVFNAAQIYGQAAATGVAAVAPVFYSEIDSGGNVQLPFGQINVEDFSALGGNLPFFFTAGGDPLPGSPVNRFKPDLAAPDGTNNTFLGVDDSFDTDTFPNFFGSSAAAAHAAAVAALIRQVNPGLTPAQVLRVMRSTARDIEATGRDPLSGDGLIDALSALTAVPRPASPTATRATPTPTHSRTATRTPSRTSPPTATATAPPTPSRTPTPIPTLTATALPTPTATRSAEPTVTPQPVRGDVNGDGRVDARDLPALFAAVFASAPARGGDVNGDGPVSAADIVALVKLLEGHA